jgi:hypothetical protein
MIAHPTRNYTVFAGLLLVAQGTSTLAALNFPVIDRMFPWLLGLTRMIPIHSSLHIATAILAFAALRLRQTQLFALGFGAFYTGLAIAGWASGRQLCLGLQPFDHPFHLILGGLGLFAWGVEMRLVRAPEGIR